MKERYNDTDLREALRRKYAEEPELPEDFVEQVMKRWEEEGLQRSEALPTTGQQHLKASPTMMRWRWMAAAACILIIISMGVTLWPDAQPLPSLQGEGAGVGSVTFTPQTAPQTAPETFAQTTLQTMEQTKIQTPPPTPPLVVPEGEPFAMWGASWSGQVVSLNIKELRENQKLFEYHPRKVVE